MVTEYFLVVLLSVVWWCQEAAVEAKVASRGTKYYFSGNSYDFLGLGKEL